MSEKALTSKSAVTNEESMSHPHQFSKWKEESNFPLPPQSNLQVIITLARQFWIPTQSINHHIILTRDVRDFRHLQLNKGSKLSLTDNSQIWLTKNPSKAVVVCAHRERNLMCVSPGRAQMMTPVLRCVSEMQHSPVEL